MLSKEVTGKCESVAICSLLLFVVVVRIARATSVSGLL